MKPWTLLAIAAITSHFTQSAKADFAILAPMGISYDKFKSLAFNPKCKYRQDEFAMDFAWSECEQPDQHIRKANFLFHNNALVGINAIFKNPIDYELNFVDDKDLLEALQNKIRSAITTPPKVKTWDSPRVSRVDRTAKLDFPMELYDNTQHGALIKYIRLRFPQGDTSTTVTEAMLFSRQESRAYLELVEANKKAQEEKSKRKFNF